MPKTIEKEESEIAKLVKDIASLHEKLDKVLDVKKPEPINSIDQLFPVPSEYGQVVSSILNKDFQIRVQPLSDSPSFQFSIIVPEKYSEMTPTQKQMNGEDVRAKVITYTEGVQGVRAYTELVFNSFNPTLQALIVADRNGN